MTGELGPLDALVSGRDIRLAIQTAVGDLKLDAQRRASAASIRWTAPISRSRLAHPDIGSMLKKLHLPAVATGR